MSAIDAEGIDGISRRDFVRRLAQAGIGTAMAANAALSNRKPDGHASARDLRLFSFFLWNDMHIRAPDLLTEHPTYPFANEKAVWAVECAPGKHELDAPDFVLSAGDLIDGEIPDYSADYRYLKTLLVDSLEVPLLPCVGNHENRQGEGIPELNHAYDECFGPGWHNYAVTYRGIGFIVVDNSGGHRAPDEVTAARNAFVERALSFLDRIPVVLAAHIPLIAMRDADVLKKSFGFSSWKSLDTRMLDIVEAHADRVIAFLCGHIHLTAVRLEQGIWHIMPSGTASYPCDFALFDVFANRIEVAMHQVPERFTKEQAGNIHGRRRHGIDYTDAEHPDHESYVRGNVGERKLTIPLAGKKKPDVEAETALTIWHEPEPGRWEKAGIISL